MDDIKITEAELKIMLRAVGLDLKPKQKEYYCNHYITLPSLVDSKPELTTLCEKGIMDFYEKDRYVFFYLTDLGLKMVQEYNAYKPKEGFVKERRSEFKEGLEAGKQVRQREIIEKLKKDVAFMEQMGFETPRAEGYYMAFLVIITELEAA